MTGHTVEYDDAVKALKEAFCRCGFYQEALEEFFAVVGDADAAASSEPSILIDGNSYAHTSLQGTRTLHILTDGTGDLAVLVTPENETDDDFDVAVDDLLFAHSGYSDAAFYGFFNVSAACWSTFDIPANALDITGLPDALRQMPLPAGMSMTASGVELAPIVLDPSKDWMSAGIGPDATVRATVPLHLGRAPLWANSVRPLYLRLEWPDLIPESSGIAGGHFALKPDGVSLEVPLAYDPQSGAMLGLGGMLVLPGDHRMHGELSLDLFDGKVLLQASNMPSFGELLTYAGADIDQSQLPGLVSGLLDIHVEKMWMALDFDAEEKAAAVLGIGLTVATEHPQEIIAGKMYFTPSLSMAAIYPALPDEREISGMVKGKFILGNVDTGVEIVASVSVPDYSLFVSVDDFKPVQVLDALGLEVNTLPDGLGNANCSLMIQGSVMEKSFFVTMELDQKGEPDQESKATAKNGSSWSLDRVTVELAYQEKAARFFITAALQIGEIKFEISGGYDDGWHFEGYCRSDIPIGQAMGHLMDQGCHPPGAAKDLVFRDVSLSADWGTGHYRFSASCPSDWQLIDGLSVRLERLVVEKTGDDDLRVEVAAILTVCDVALVLKGAKHAGGWALSGSTRSVVAPAALIKELTGAAADLPEFVDTMAVDRLEVSYDTDTGKLDFGFTGKAGPKGSEVTAEVSLCAKKSEKTGGWEIDVEVGVDLSGHMVKGEVHSTTDGIAFLGVYTAAPNSILHTRSALKGLSPVLADVLPDIEIGFRSLLVGYIRSGGVGKFVCAIALDLETTIDLSELPIGDVVGDGRLGIENLRLLIASHSFTGDDIQVLTDMADTADLLPSSGAADGDDAAQVLAVGLNLSAELNLGAAQNFQMLTGSGRNDTAPQEAAKSEPNNALAAAPASDGRLEKWFGVQKSLGPLFVAQVGLHYEEGRVGLLVDSGFDMGGVHIGLKGFGISFPLETPVGAPQVSLRGLELGYSGGPVTLSGAFIETPTLTGPRYDGLAVLKAANFTVAGFGSYQQISGADGQGDPSIFIFASLQADLGGPPFFHVKGIAGGFGYNRDLILPDVSRVNEFPLIRAIQDVNYISGDAPENSAMAALDKLADYVHPVAGQYWVAAGVKIDTYGVVDSALLLSVSFGTDIEIGVLGLSTMSLPRDAEKGQEIAFVELGLKATFRPSEGFLAVEARLTDKSYILSKDCHLTGGFAFYLWAAGEHSGDFVITLGGYHPDFLRPAHYPIVPRLGVDWQVTPELHVMAQMYFAITPSCVMAGGLLQAVYQSGCIAASFMARADFIMYWEPLRYAGNVEVSIHVSADLGLFVFSTELSVHLEFWGPEFAGQLNVRVAAISFTISFGNERSADSIFSIEDFKNRFLPPVEAGVVAASISGGLEGMRPAMAGQPVRSVRFVNADELEFVVMSAVPFRTISGATMAPDPEQLDILGVAPAGFAAIDPQLHLELWSQDRSSTKQIALTAIAQVAKVPAALWDRATADASVNSSLKPPPKPSANTLRSMVGLRVGLGPQAEAPDQTAMLEQQARSTDRTVTMPDQTIAVESGPQGAPASAFDAPPATRKLLIELLRPDMSADVYTFEPSAQYLKRMRAMPVFCALGATDEAEQRQ